MQRILGSMGLAALLIATLPAQATLIDFTASNSNPVNAGGVTATVTGSGSLTWTAFDGNAGAAPCLTSLLACDNDGIGIGDDEITFNTEWLLVSFSQAVNVTNIHLFDLFGINDDAAGNPAERAWMGFYNSSSILLDSWLITGTAAPGTVSGYATRAGLVGSVSSVRFYTNEVANSDFALAGIEFVAVPEPSMLMLLGGGLLGFGLIRRRRV